MSDWLSWAEVLEALQKRDSELLELFQEGLQPYKPYGREKIYCPAEHHRYFQVSSRRLEKIGPEIRRLKNLENPDKQEIKDLKELEELKPSLEKEMRKISARDSNVKRDHERLSWEFFNPPNTEEGIEKLIHDLDLKNALFKRDNVEEIQKAFGEKLDKEIDSTAPADFIFQKTGPTWEIVYERKKTRGLRARGFGYIHYLVQHSGKDFDTDELAKAVDGLDPKLIRIDPSTERKNGNDWRDVTDAKTKTEFKKERARLTRQVEEAENNNDLPLISKAKRDLEEFDQYCLEMIRPGGISRKFVDESTRNMNRINKSIARALDELKNYDEKAAQRTPLTGMCVGFSNNS
jgi:hypothetical protein